MSFKALIPNISPPKKKKLRKPSDELSSLKDLREDSESLLIPPSQKSKKKFTLMNLISPDSPRHCTTPESQPKSSAQKDISRSIPLVSITRGTSHDSVSRSRLVSTDDQNSSSSSLHPNKLLITQIPEEDLTILKLSDNSILSVLPVSLEQAFSTLFLDSQFFSKYHASRGDNYVQIGAWPFSSSSSSSSTSSSTSSTSSSTSTSLPTSSSSNLSTHSSNSLLSNSSNSFLTSTPSNSFSFDNLSSFPIRHISYISTVNFLKVKCKQTQQIVNKKNGMQVHVVTKSEAPFSLSNDFTIEQIYRLEANDANSCTLSCKGGPCFSKKPNSFLRNQIESSALFELNTGWRLFVRLALASLGQQKRPTIVVAKAPVPVRSLPPVELDPQTLKRLETQHYYNLASIVLFYFILHLFCILPP